MRMNFSLKCVAMVLACVLAASCDDAKNGPSGPSPNPPPVTPSAPQLRNLELNGQTTLAPGATSEFTLIAVFTDGTRTDVTSSAQWSTRSSTYATSLGQGRISAIAVGDTFLDARYSNRNTSREIIIVPDGTFRVTGRILEEDGVTPVANAHIRVRDADAAGPQTDADVSGYYRLYGVKRNIDLVVTREGYVDTERKNLTIDRHTAVNIVLPLMGPRLKVDGTYTVTFDWSNCASGFPTDLRHRVYSAVIKQSEAEIEVRFTEPGFVHNTANRGDLMEGRVGPSGMYLFADSGYYYAYYGAASSPFLTELLPGDLRLVTWGSAFLTQSGNRFSGAMDGGAWVYRRVGQTDTYLGGCNNGNVSFERR